MVDVVNSFRNKAAIPVGGRAGSQRNRLINVLDIGVLIAALLIFMLFLFVLIRIVFPQGSGLGDISFDTNSAFFGADDGSDVGLSGANVSSLKRFYAQLGDVRRDVKIRRADGIAWSSASTGISVRNGDALQTFIDSRARVDFTTDNELRIGQNSLIVFRSGAADPFLQRRDPALIMLDGELNGVINSDYGSFAVQFPAGVVELTSVGQSDESVNFRIGVNADNSSSISVFSGQADINVAGEHYFVSANQGVTIAEDGRSAGIRALPPLPIVRQPDDNTVVGYLDVPPRVTFRWGRVSGTQNYRLEIAKDTAFREILVDEYLDATSFTHGNLASGDYFWRVSARAGWTHGPVSIPRRLSVVNDSNPPLLELQPIQHITADRYVLRGKTAVDAKVYVLGMLVNKSIGGNFEYFFNPEPGTQSIVVESIDAVGNVAYGSQVLHVPGKPRRSE